MRRGANLWSGTCMLLCSASSPRAYTSMTVPDTMQCILYGGRGGCKKATRPVPSPRRGHVLVRVAAVGLNPVDAKFVVGDKLPYEWMKSWVQSHYLPNKIPGFDFAGTVVDGTSEEFAAGSKVFGTMPPFQGTLAEYISVPIDQTWHMPSSCSFEQASALPLVGLTALQALSPHVNSQSSVLVIGASGGAGHVALQVASRCLGASKVTAVCSNKNDTFCRTMGATDVIAYDDAGNVSMREKLEQAAEGSPFNVVMDCVSSADPRDQSLFHYPSLLQEEQPSSKQLLSSDYVYRRLGGPTGDWIRAGLERSLGFSCWKNPHEKLFWIRFPRSSHELLQLQEWSEAGKLKAHISQTYDFTAEGVNEAFAALNSRRVKGKVVVRVRSEDCAAQKD